MESKRGSENRGQRSTSFQPHSGILTRRKYKIYLLSHMDSSSSKDLQDGLLNSPRKKPRRLPNKLSPEDDELSRCLIKDIRIKRIFSPNVADEGQSVPLGERVSNAKTVAIENGSCFAGDNGIGKSFEEIAKVQNVNVCNSKSCSTNEDVESGDRLNAVPEPVDRKSEEITHSTPPDAEILARDFLGVSSDGCPRSSNGCVEEGFHANIDRIDSLSKTRLVLKPCFKRKLFKAPGSIAYKRLLPYLLDNETCVFQDDPYPKRENNLEKRVSLPLPGEIPSFSKPLVNENTVTFQNGNPCESHQFRDLNLVTEGYCVKNDVICASCPEKRLTENGEDTNSQIEHLSDREQPKASRLKKLDGANSSLSANLSSEVEESKACVAKKLGDSVHKDIKSENNFTEQSLQTRLYSEISFKPVTEEKRNEKVDCNRGGDQNPCSTTVSENLNTIDIASDKKHNPGNKLVRNPLLQLKVFSSQGSVNYRRMLPFLKDLIKENSENSCGLNNIDVPRLEKGLAMTHSQLPSLISENSLDKSDGFLSGIKPAVPAVCETEKNLVFTGGNDKQPTTLNPQKQQVQSETEMVDKCKLDVDHQLQSAELLSDHAATSLYPAATHESLTVEGTTLNHTQSLVTSEDCTRLTADVSDDAERPETNSSQPNPSCVDANVPSKYPTNIRKGILKSNPRGCRGICTCLNCSSFHLHAERAFEFSKNQLLDAEEVTLDLMKELSYLRDMLEKSADAAHDDAGCHLSKVKEACRKASEAESFAKNRLEQMNYELDIHCRITCTQRPNVKFSGEIQKRA